MQGYMINVYDTLYVNKENPPKLEPWLATGHTVSEDGTTVEFKLRDGVKFHDGNPLTSADVVWSYQRMLNVKKGPAAAFLPVLDPSSVTAPDARTVVFRLKKPYAPFVAATPLVAIVNRRLIEPNIKDNDWGQAWLASNAAGSGLTSLDISTYQPVQQIDLKRNHDHFMGWSDNKSPIEIVRKRTISGDHDARQRADQGRRRLHRQLSAGRPGRTGDGFEDGDRLRRTRACASWCCA